MRLTFLLVFLLVAGCADRERIDRLSAGTEGQNTRSVFIGTTRLIDTQSDTPSYRRDSALHFARYDVVIPPENPAGRVRMPRRHQAFDPAQHFAVSDAALLSPAEYRSGVARALSAMPENQRESIIFVHGFNTSFIEGVYRVAQLGNDLRLPGVVLHYSWPSLGAPLAYAHDRDSALFARDGLEQMIRETAATSRGRVVIIGHSMGGHLVMEVLRQIAISGDRQLMGRISGVVLISPDLDVDLFRAQATRIGALPQPFLIVSSQRDRILQLSARLTGQRERLGNLSDAGAIDGLGVTMLDVSAFSTGAGHFTVGTSPALIQLLEQVGAVETALGLEQAGRLPLLPATILTLQNTTQIILQPLTGTRPWRAAAQPQAVSVD
ncbi:alpha/beta hydrolase [Pararhodobacter sp.]|uniref:alpha/beta hydrolase n=1 Tax=Pararhodobacter sp. TaxID=2127056 RepID=UPI002FDDCB6F